MGREHAESSSDHGPIRHGENSGFGRLSIDSTDAVNLDWLSTFTRSTRGVGKYGDGLVLAIDVTMHP